MLENTVENTAAARRAANGTRAGFPFVFRVVPAPGVEPGCLSAGDFKSPAYPDKSTHCADPFPRTKAERMAKVCSEGEMA